ncbi:unnamed protein product [Mycena citricolor]|uniref:F-box domain-containing protein n=1 Tax=Mycena citricolor TaxID=2018698 RepID=A0AAD2HBD1_9AGAR|nr:unnamed protein product [Mycena citricolor]
MPSNSILDLPPELIHVCLSYLPLADIYTLEHLVGNTLLRSLITSSVAIAYRRALHSACVEESPTFSHPASSPSPVSDRLRLLRRTNERFTAFDPVHRGSLTVPFPTTSIYDLAGDVFVLGDGCGEMVDGRCTGVRVLQTRVAAAAAAKSEGLVEGVDEDVWRRINAGKPIIDFGLAVEEHDLIAMVTYVSVDQTRRQIDVSFFHFSTGAPHSQARRHVLPVQETDTAHGPPTVSIEIVGENLAMSLFYGNAHTAERDSLHVFNWRTGMRKKSDFFPVSSPGLIFLTPRHLLLPDVRVQYFVIVEYPDSDSEVTEPALALLEFPSIMNHTEVLHVQCRVSPTAAASPNSPASSGAPSSRFVPRAEDAIILFSFAMGRFDQQGLLQAADDHVFVISKRPLYDKLLGGPMSRERLSWDEWAAPAMCYIDGEDLHFRYITVTHGQRLVYIDHAAAEARAPVRILDFNAGRFEDARRRGAVDGPHAVVQPMEGGKPRGIVRQFRAFRKPLESTLPYVETTSKELFDWGAAIINDECILGVQFGVIAHALSLEVLHFGEL